MADNNAGKAGLTTKQKATAGALVVIVLVIAWQAMGMMGGKSAPPAPAHVAAPVKLIQPSGMTSPPGGNGNNAAAAMQQQQPQQTELTQVNVVQPHNDSQMFTEQQSQQKEYVKKLNELQILKITQQIEETNQAIEAARLATAMADKNMSDLLTKPLPPPVPLSTYTTGIGGMVQSGMNELSANKQSSSAPSIPETAYVVISVSEELGKWHAVVGYGGKLFSVSVGDILPVDNSIVVAINTDGVTLKKDSKERMITIVSSV